MSSVRSKEVLESSIVQNRITGFANSLKDKGLDGFIVTNPVNIFYLAGFRGISPTERESILVFNPKPTLIAPALYQTEVRQIRSKDLKVTIVRERDEMYQTAIRLLSKCRVIGFEQEDLRFGEHQDFKKNLKARLIPYKDLVESQRITKTAEEIKNIETAQIISQKAFSSIIQIIKPGMTEEKIAEKLAKIIKSIGGHGLAFESIVASGPNSGRPHYFTGDRRLTMNDILLLDFGAKYKNYHADLTRVIFIGQPSDQKRNIFSHVLAAQKAAIDQLTAGIRASDAFYLANDHFKNHKLHNNFTHGLGHGVGLEIHEAPYLRKTNDEELITENMVFSVEPGLYFPWGGIRIEDLVVIEGGKAKVLGKQMAELIAIK